MAQSSPLRVVASIQPWASLLAEVGGDYVDVVTLLPPGASPHAFEPLPSHAAALARADLIILNGGLDGWLARMVEATAPTAEVVVVMERVAFEPIVGHEHDGEDDHADAVHGSEDEEPEWATANPHVWLDPSIAAQAVSVFSTALSHLRPELAGTFEARAAATVSTLASLEEELSQVLAPVAERPFVPFHDAWAYFARRFGLEVLVTLEPFPGREPSARYVAETVATIRDAGATVIFDERQLSGRTAAVVAESAGVEVVMLDPIGGPPGPVGYADLLTFNAERIAEALGGR